MLKTAEHVIYGATSVYALCGDHGVAEWQTDNTAVIPKNAPCSRCDHQSKCLTLGNGKIDVAGCPIAEGWHDAKAAYEAAIKAR